MNEEDEDIQLGSPSPSPNGTLNIPLATSSSPPLSPSPPPSDLPPSILGINLPPQQHRSSNGGREDCWSEGATEVLIDAWGERYRELSRGNLRQKHWQEVADIVSSRCGYKRTPKTDVQCKNRVDTVKKKYKVEKSKISSGGVSNWALFDKLDGLIGPLGKSPLPSANKVGSRQKKKKKKKKKKVESEEEEDDDADEEDLGFDSDDGLPPPRKVVPVVKREEVTTVEKTNDHSPFRVLSDAIVRFGEVYERAENAKLSEVVEMEKARMRFAKEVELQRMHFFMKSQMEIVQLWKRGERNGTAGNNHQQRRINHRRHHRHEQPDGSAIMDKNACDNDV